jgi:putative transposase
MNCPSCASSKITESSQKTALGYCTFHCSACQRRFNERTGTPFNRLEFPSDIALLVVLWRLGYKLSLRDLAEMFLVRGFEFTHEAVRDWEAHFAPLLTQQLRARRRGQVGRSWYVGQNEQTCHQVQSTTIDSIRFQASARDNLQQSAPIPDPWRPVD